MRQAARELAEGRTLWSEIGADTAPDIGFAASLRSGVRANPKQINYPTLTKRRLGWGTLKFISPEDIS
jgi:hypothetical protein